MVKTGSKCLYSGCDKKAIKRGYCDTHYHSAVNAGLIITAPRMNTNGKPSTHPLYRCWASMKNRCYNKKDERNYRWYGGRGIKVCDRWIGENGFWNFVSDMGPKPSSEYSLDRIDTEGDYSPENCRWSSPREQARNRRTNVKISYKGKNFSAWEISMVSGQCIDVVRRKIKKGMPIEEVFCDMRKNNWEETKKELESML